MSENSQIIEQLQENNLSDFVYQNTGHIIPLKVFTGFANPALAGKDLVAEILKINDQENPGPIFYVAGTHNKIIAEKNSNKQTTVLESGFYKVVNNLTSFSITPVNQDDADFIGLNKITVDTVKFQLPKIPYELREKMDQFFRIVDKKYGTESIVLLTFDPSKNDSSGWNILIPKQENTAAHCNYDPTSVAEIKPDHVSIVGSVHSHPNMDAYASGTDHKDQADFDGLHITYGWSFKTNYVTEYYAEIQASGKAYQIAPEAIFEQPNIEVELDQDILDKIDTVVSKEVPTVTTTSSWNLGNTTKVNPGSGKPYGSTNYSNAIQIGPCEPVNYPGFAKSKVYDQVFPSLEENYIIGAAIKSDNGDKSFCPFCGSPLLSLEMNAQKRCIECLNYLYISDDKNIEDLVKARTKVGLDTEFNPNKTTKPVYWWDSDPKNHPTLAFSPASSTESVKK